MFECIQISGEGQFYMGMRLKVLLISREENALLVLLKTLG